jgi:hypothetical protein
MNSVRAYWVSTPTFTVLVVVDEGGVIRHTAAYLRRQWLGEPWANVSGSLRRRYGAGLKVERLEWVSRQQHWKCSQ